MTECPTEVIECGKELIKARKTAEKLSKQIDDAVKSLESATEVIVKNNDKATIMQSGEAIANLREAQKAYGLILSAHSSLSDVLCACDVDRPTDEQVLSIR